METGIEPVCTALQAVASPLGHSTAGLMPLASSMRPRADDGIRTRDPHLGKVMRYQLRYIRAQRTRSSSGAMHDDSPPRDVAQIAWTARRGLAVGLPVLAGCASRARFDVVQLALPGPVAQWESVRLTRGRSVVRNHSGPPTVLQVSDII